MPDLVGTWRLVGAVARDPEGRPLPLPYGPQAIAASCSLPTNA